MGQVSPPLSAFLQKLSQREQRILIPGAGYGHEARWLWQEGFRQIKVLDYSAAALAALQEHLPEDALVAEDFFNHQGQYDLIVEQTFFCALDPALRGQYAQKMAELLAPGASLVGLLFDFPLSSDGPPFGGHAAEYRRYFEEHFKIHKMEACYNSIPPRQGRELFLHLIRK